VWLWTLRAKRADGEAAKTVASLMLPVSLRDARLAAHGAITHNSQATNTLSPASFAGTMPDPDNQAKVFAGKEAQ
jgi:hypothetical protein